MRGVYPDESTFIRQLNQPVGHQELPGILDYVGKNQHEPFIIGFNNFFSRDNQHIDLWEVIRKYFDKGYSQSDHSDKFALALK
jgi:hypothetical protein